MYENGKGRRYKCKGRCLWAATVGHGRGRGQDNKANGLEAQLRIKKAVRKRNVIGNGEQKT